MQTARNNMVSFKISIIGLGYVGLPLAVAFAEKYPVVGFDLNLSRINELRSCRDSTYAFENNHLQNVMASHNPFQKDFSPSLFVTDKKKDIEKANCYIITVPTPVDKNRIPDLQHLLNATKTVGNVLQQKDIVIYESTVYPGCTEDKCVPALEKASGMVYNRDFFVGYSPERMNPGDNEHTVITIKKVTSGSTPEVARKIDSLYASIISAGTHLAPSIKVAEAAKVIENTQRDINIALVNELAIIFNKMNIDTLDVLEAAGTKWNFMPFKPGLVGGHCIGVDPYYLAQKAQEIGYHPEIILSGRRLNDNMGNHIVSEIVKLMIKKGIKIKNANILVLGITFKENCSDIRNSKVVDIINIFTEYGANVEVFDPWADHLEVLQEYGLKCLKKLENRRYQTIILAVAHENFKSLKINNLRYNKNTVIYDVKSILDRSIIDGRL